MAKRRFLRTYQLEQQTPMIHFQYDEEGAIIRASDAKPKLDRFIIDRMNDQKKEIPEEWYIGYIQGKKNESDKQTLNYKMRFYAEEQGRYRNGKLHKLYFGNIKRKESDKIKTVFYKNIRMTIFCLNPELLETIDSVLPYFFAITAFGTRSGKGFGCFQIIDLPGFNEERLAEYCPLKCFYKINYGRKKQPEDYLNDIWVLSNMMKGGINLSFKVPTDYYKGQIFKYFINHPSKQKFGSEKAYIKSKLLTDNRDVHSEDKKSYHNYLFVRAMLGIPDSFTYRSTPKITRNGTVGVSHEKINRFASPVLYRIQGSVLYIIPVIIPDLLFNESFSLCIKKDDKNIGKNTAKSITTPRVDQFNLIEFLDYFIKEFNKEGNRKISSFKNSMISNTEIASNLSLRIEKKVVKQDADI